MYMNMINSLPAWISNYMYITSEVWDEITYPFLNFNGKTWSLGMDK